MENKWSYCARLTCTVIIEDIRSIEYCSELCADSDRESGIADECVICFDITSNMMVLCCNNFVCQSCYVKIKRCPICRKDIKIYVRPKATIPTRSVIIPYSMSPAATAFFLRHITNPPQHWRHGYLFLRITGTE